MNILAISGSTRLASTNTAFLKALSTIAPDGMTITVFDRIGKLPVFSPDLEEQPPAPEVANLIRLIQTADGLIISSPEYVRNIPGGLKNAIDWLVSGDELIGKPIALAHASHRGDDMISALRLVLSTVSSGFNEGLFLRVPLLHITADKAETAVRAEPHRAEALAFLNQLADHIENTRSPMQSAEC